MYVLLRTHSENHVDKHASVPLRYSYITHVTHADGGNIYTPTTGKARNPGQNILQEQPKLTHKHIHKHTPKHTHTDVHRFIARGGFLSDVRV